ncbi:uncharacterized protein ACNS7B_015395 [Menidia menidia]
MSRIYVHTACHMLTAGWAVHVEPKKMEEAGYRITSQAVHLDTWPLKWPIAPDGYIPNSVIRSWMKKGKGFCQPNGWDDFFLNEADECGPDDLEAELLGALWFMDDEEDEEEKTAGGKRKRRVRRGKNTEKREDKANPKGKIDENQGKIDENKGKIDDNQGNFDENKGKIDKYKGKIDKNKGKTDDKEHKENEKKGKEKLKAGQARAEQSMQTGKKGIDRFVPEPLRDIQPETAQKEPQNSVEEHLGSLNTDIDPRDTWANNASFVSGKDLRSAVDRNGREPLRELTDGTEASAGWSEPSSQIVSTLQNESAPGGPAKGFLKLPVRSHEVRAESLATQLEHGVEAPLPKPPPPSPSDLQPQLESGPTETPPTKDPKIILCSAKYENIQGQAQSTLDTKTLHLHRKFQVYNRKISHVRKATSADRLPTSPPVSWGLPDGCDESAPVWRRTLRGLISLQGFRSHRAARQWSAQDPGRPQQKHPSTGSIPSLQPGQATGLQRVVQGVQMTEAPEPDPPPSTCRVIPMASQLNFFTLRPRGTTWYGRLQFDWMRGGGEGESSPDSGNLGAGKLLDGRTFV